MDEISLSERTAQVAENLYNGLAETTNPCKLCESYNREERRYTEPCLTCCYYFASKFKCRRALEDQNGDKK